MLFSGAAALQELFILDSTAMISYSLKSHFERLFNFLRGRVCITMHFPPSSYIVNQIRDFVGNVCCFTPKLDSLREASHLGIYVQNEGKKLDTLRELCLMATSAPVLVCCGLR
ncbi:unnamed protein product, partial [Gongylonema pulchrum]|uniref:STAS domain-containing protein n=1 Tax=Gongylonema pulchrum TaxID=637853 RepID=A0A183DBG6_9BILA